MAIRRGMQGGNRKEQQLQMFMNALGQAGKGLGGMVKQGQEDTAANTQMQQMNTLNPPRAALVNPTPGQGDASSNLAAFQQENPQVPTAGTQGAPAGQGATGLKMYIANQNLQRANQSAALNQQYKLGQLGQQPLTAQKTQLEIDALKNKPQPPPGGNMPAAITNAAIKVQQANSMAQQYGFSLDQAAKYASGWHISQDGTFYTNDQLSRELNHQVAIPPASFDKFGPQMMDAIGTQHYLQNSPWAKQVQDLGTQYGAGLNTGQTQPVQPQVNNNDGTATGANAAAVERANPQIRGSVPQQTGNMSMPPPGQVMPTGPVPSREPGPNNNTMTSPAGAPNVIAQQTGAAQPAPTVAGQTGKSSADEYINSIIGGANNGQ